MIVKCPECQQEYNLELDDVVVELNFTCPNCGVDFKVRNTTMTDVERHNERYASVRSTSPQPSTVLPVKNEMDDDIERFVESKKKWKRSPISINHLGLRKNHNEMTEGHTSGRLKNAVVVMGIVFAVSLVIWIYINIIR